MSKLADLIRRTTRVEGRRLGFGSGPRQSQASMLLVALVPERWSQGASDATAAGADVVLLTGRPADKDIADAASAAKERPSGVLAPEVDPLRLATLREAGLDFVALDTHAPASALNENDLGFVLHIRDDLTDIQLRTLESLHLDALYLETNAAPLTIARLMELRRVTGLARRPLLLPVRQDAGQDELVALRESGVGLLAIDMKERGAADAMKRLRGVIDGLPKRRASRDDARGEAMLPRAASAHEHEDDEDDD